MGTHMRTLTHMQAGLVDQISNTQYRNTGPHKYNDLMTHIQAMTGNGIRYIKKTLWYLLFWLLWRSDYDRRSLLPGDLHARVPATWTFIEKFLF